MSFSWENRQRIWHRDRGLCVNCKMIAMDIHHIIANTKTNIRIYGDDRVQSAENGVLVCRQCHENTSWAKELRAKLKEKWKINKGKIK